MKRTADLPPTTRDARRDGRRLHGQVLVLGIVMFALRDVPWLSRYAVGARRSPSARSSGSSSSCAPTAAADPQRVRPRRRRRRCPVRTDRTEPSRARRWRTSDRGHALEPAATRRSSDRRASRPPEPRRRRSCARSTRRAQACGLRSVAYLLSGPLVYGRGRAGCSTDWLGTSWFVLPLGIVGGMALSLYLDLGPVRFALNSAGRLPPGACRLPARLGSAPSPDPALTHLSCSVPRLRRSRP